MCDLKNPLLENNNGGRPRPTSPSLTLNQQMAPQTLLSLPSNNFPSNGCSPTLSTISKNSSRSSLDPIMGKVHVFYEGHKN